MIPVIKSTYSNGPLHRTLISTDLSARVVLPKQTLSPNSSRGQLLHSSLEFDCLYLVCRAIFARQNDPRNMGKSLTDCLSGAVQVTSVLPSFFTSPTSFSSGSSSFNVSGVPGKSNVPVCGDGPSESEWDAAKTGEKLLHGWLLLWAQSPGDRSDCAGF